jgi:hypothetical protein
MEVWIGLMSAGIGTIVGAAAGAVATTITTRNRVDLELRAEFDNELRRLRFPVYQALHAASERLPREWLPGNEPTRADLRALRETFHKWYFGPQAGGMLLSEKARQAYFDVQNSLQQVGNADGGGAVSPVSPEERDELLKRAHSLREQLRQDLGTAEAPKLKWTARGVTPPPPPPSGSASD